MKRNPKTGNISTFGNDSIFSVKYWKSSTSSCKEIGIRKKVRKKHKIWQKKYLREKLKQSDCTDLISILTDLSMCLT